MLIFFDPISKLMGFSHVQMYPACILCLKLKELNPEQGYPERMRIYLILNL